MGLLQKILLFRAHPEGYLQPTVVKWLSGWVRYSHISRLIQGEMDCQLALPKGYLSLTDCYFTPVICKFLVFAPYSILL